MNTKVCFVPICPNSSENSPGKLFLTVPASTQRRKNWLDAVHLKFISGHDLYCCEDHFNLEDDAANWMFFKIIGKTLKLKPHVVPHKFLNEPPPTNNRSVVTDEEKKRKAELLENFLKKPKIQPSDYSEPSSSKNVENSSVPDIIEVEEEIVKVCLNKTSIGIQTNIKGPFRSKGVNTENKTFHDVGTQPMHHIKLREKNVIKPCCVKPPFSSSDTISESLSSPTREYELNSSTDFDEIAEEIADRHKEASRKKTEIYAIEHNSRFFLGIPGHIYKIVHLICEEGSISYEECLITLKKIRLNDQYQRLAIDFGVSISNIQRIFTKTVPKMANVLQNFVFWPDTIDIEKNIPITFRARYSNVQSIIDCFEVEIEKPSDPVIQANTWSEYKSCNTVKFLLSCTPNGFINFISKAYGGRISDTEIVKKSTYLNELPTNVSVLADRGFKHIATLIQEKGCELVRPPSVSSQIKSTPQEVRDSKIIASLRIHVERVIRRIREFSILEPHSCVHHSLVSLLSFLVIIVCALVNMQESIIN